MLRKLAIAPLLLAYLAMTCRVALPLVNYAVNYDSYLERCENKDKPELECDGSCQVEKEVAEAAAETSNADAGDSSRAFSVFVMELVHLSPSSFIISCPCTELRRVLPPNDFILLSGFAALPFQPPRS